MPIRAKIYILAALCLIIFFGFGFISYFLILKLRTESQEHLKIKSEFLSIGEQRKTLDEIQNLLAKSRGDIDHISQAFLSSEEIPTFIETLEEIAKKSQVRFSIEYIPADQPQKNPDLNFRVSIFGRFRDALRFLANLENVPFAPYRLVEIKDLTLRRLEAGDVRAKEFQESGAIEGMIEAKISMKVFLK